jgi:hypothetical protein
MFIKKEQNINRKLFTQFTPRYIVYIKNNWEKIQICINKNIEIRNKKINK